MHRDSPISSKSETFRFYVIKLALVKCVCFFKNRETPS